MHHNVGESVHTRADHEQDPRKYPICGTCKAVWKQRGERTGHCAGCGRTFEGVRLFDMHQMQGEGGATVCLNPRETKVGQKWLRLVDGTWRGAPISQDVLDSFKG